VFPFLERFLTGRLAIVYRPVMHPPSHPREMGDRLSGMNTPGCRRPGEGAL
jgi:hypothetical protein